MLKIIDSFFGYKLETLYIFSIENAFDVIEVFGIYIYIRIDIE